MALSAASFVILGSTINLLTAVLALVGNLFYVVVYTGYLKRRGPGNIVLGGAAGPCLRSSAMRPRPETSRSPRCGCS